ncbi:hypothetical protein JCM5296_000511 [Sporobolomyces johnsonii]
MSSNLLPLPFKHTQPLPTLASDLVNYVASSSDSTHPDAVKPDAQDLQQIRLSLFGTDGLPATLQSTARDLIAYYAQLSYAMTKFPSSLPISFPWYPLFSLPTPAALPGALPPSSLSPSSGPTPLPLAAERLATLYSLAALYSILATERRRTDEQGIKGAIAGLQAAAGVLDVVLREGGGGEGEGDLAKDAVQSMRDLCLAEAQEVAWQKAVMDRLKNGTISKLALRTSELYASAREAAIKAATPVSTTTNRAWSFPEEWLRYMQLKKLHFAAVAQYRRSIDDSGANRYGDELGRLQLADQLLRDALAVKVPKGGVLEMVVRDAKGLQKTVQENLARATKDNDLIYLSFPTPPSSLPPITAFTLVKPTPPPEILHPLSYLHANAGGLGRPLFEALVPREVSEVVRLWEDRKKEWVERVARGRVGELEREATSTLAALSLPAALEASLQPLGIPPHLLDQAESIRAQGGLERLETMMKDVRRVKGVNERLLQEATDHLSSESTLDASHAQQHGTLRWTRAPSSVASAPLLARAQELRHFLTTASETDALVRAKYAEWEGKIRVLEAGREGDGDGDGRLTDALPAATSEAGAAAARAQTRALRGALDLLEDLVAARAELGRAAKTAVLQADIRDKVLRAAEAFAALRERSGQDGGEGGGGGGGEGEGEGEGTGLERFEELLQSELRALTRGFEEEIDASRARQEDLLNEIKTLNASFLSHRRHDPALLARETALQELSTAHAKYHEMRGNLEEGLRFYAELSRLGSELRDAAKSFAYSRNVEAQELHRQLSTVSSPSPSPASPSPAPTPSASGEPAAAPPSSTPARKATSKTRTPARTPASAAGGGSGASGTPNRANTRASTRLRRTAHAIPEPEVEEEEADELEEQDDGEAEPAALTPRSGAAVGGWDPSLGIRFG